MRYRFVLIGMIAILAAGCGYSTNSRTAKDIKSIAVPFFDNQTSEPALEITVTESIIQNLVFDNTLKVVDEDDADAVLRGQIVMFENRPFSFNAELRAEEYHVVIKVKAELFNRQLDEAVWKDRTFKGDGSYFLDVPDTDSTFDDAVDEAIKEITEQILNITVQDW
jgi:outer membrane lipopolysaccharide assembly protein LptE/RlpB